LKKQFPAVATSLVALARSQSYLPQAKLLARRWSAGLPMAMADSPAVWCYRLADCGSARASLCVNSRYKRLWRSIAPEKDRQGWIQQIYGKFKLTLTISGSAVNYI